MAIDEESLQPVQAKIPAAMLQRLGATCTLPTAIRHGPVEMGGLALLDLQTEYGIETILNLCNSIYRDTSAGRLMLICLQLESGISQPLLESPSIRISYLTSTWLASIRQYLYVHNLSITVTTSITPKMRGGHNDMCIMEHPILQQFTPYEHLDINLVCLHLQIWTISDLSTSDERNITKTVFQVSDIATAKTLPNGQDNNRQHHLKPASGNTSSPLIFFTIGRDGRSP